VASTLDDLLSQRTQAQEEALLLSELQALGFPITDWEPGGAARTFVKGITKEMADHSSLISTVTAGGLILFAKDLKNADGTENQAWLRLFAKFFYDLDAAEATFTVQRCKLTCQVGNGPLSINSGFTAAAAPSGNRYIYQGTSPVSVPDGGTATIDLTAESPGAKYSDPAGSIQTVVTSLPGLSVNNPNLTFGGLNTAGQATKSTTNQGTGNITPSGSPVLSRQFIITVLVSGNIGVGQVKIEAIEAGVRSTIGTPTTPATFSAGDGVTLTFANGAGAGFVAGDVHTFQTPGSPILQQGTDAEGNQALAARCIGRWPSLSPNAIGDKYVLMIQQASLDGGYGVEKITIQPSATIAGVAEILTATASGAPSSPTITALQAYVDARSGITEKANVSGAVNKNVTIAGSVTVKNADIATVKAAADSAWAAYIKALPIGGDRRTGSPGVVRLFELTQVMMDAGAIDVSGLQLGGAATNLSLLFNEVAVVPAGQEPSNALTWNPVAG
jgi:hypothetical protein